MSRRFRSFLPVVVDVETGGFNCATDALLEIAAVMIEFGPDGRLHRGESHSYHVRPFEGSNIEPASLAVNGIDPWHPLRPAIPEKDREKIFDRYYQIEARRASARENRGLGLYFCRLAAEAHGGSIAVASEPALPTVFQLRLPQP